MTKYEQLKKETEELILEVERIKANNPNLRSSVDSKNVAYAFCAFCQKNNLKLFEFQERMLSEIDSIENNIVVSDDLTIEEIKYYYLTMDKKENDFYFFPEKREVLAYLQDNFGPTLSERMENLERITKLIDSVLIKRKVESLNEESLNSVFKEICEVNEKKLAEYNEEKEKIKQKYRVFGLDCESDLDYKTINAIVEKLETNQAEIEKINASSVFDLNRVKEFIISLLGKEVIYKELDIDLFFSKKYVDNIEYTINIFLEADQAVRTIENIKSAEEEIKNYTQLKELAENILNSDETIKYFQTEKEKEEKMRKDAEIKLDAFSGERNELINRNLKAKLFQHFYFQIKFAIQILYNSKDISSKCTYISDDEIIEMANECLTSNVDNVKDFVCMKFAKKVDGFIISYNENIDLNKKDLIKFARRVGIEVNDEMSCEKLSSLVNESIAKIRHSSAGYYTNPSNIEEMVEYTNDYNEDYYAQHSEIDEDFLTALQQKYFENLGISNEGKSKR